MKLTAQPYCRCCGAPIRKRTRSHYFGHNGPDSTWASYHPQRLTEKAEVQRLFNEQIVSISRNVDRSIWRATTWDGESYEDDTFCKQACGVAFGRMAAREYPTLETQAAYDARKAREARKDLA